MIGVIPMYFLPFEVKVDPLWENDCAQELDSGQGIEGKDQREVEDER